MQKFIGTNRWVVLLAGALIQIFTGVPAAWGVFQKAVSSGYNLSQGDTAMIFSFVICTFGLGCVLGGCLQDRAGPRIAAIIGAVLLGGGFISCAFLPAQNAAVIWVCFSAPVGLGTALLYPAVMSCAQKWYVDKKGFATGVIGGAAGLSGAVLTFLGTWLIDKFDIRTAFFVIGTIMAVVCGAACTVLENPSKSADKKGETLQNDVSTAIKNDMQSNNFTAVQMLKTRQYKLLTAAVCLATPSMILFSPVIVDIATERGLTQALALANVAVGSVFSAGGRLLMPWLSDKWGRRAVLMLLFAVLCGASVVFMFAQGIFVLAVYCTLAFCYSAQAAVLPSAVTDLFGQKASGLHYGLVALGMSLGSVVFPALSNLMQNKVATKHVIAVVATALGFVCVLLLRPTRNKKL